MRPKLVAVIGAVFGLILAGGAANAAMVAGMVLGMSGPSAAQNQALRPGEPIEAGVAISVPLGSNLKLQMKDRSLIALAPGTTMTIARYDFDSGGRHVQLALAHGLMHLLVTRIAGPSTFQVSTQTGTASVRSNSADWLIAVQPNGVQAGVLSGMVVLTGTTSRSVSIPAHWGTRLEPGLDPMLPRVWGQVEFDAFLRRTECCQPSQPGAEPAPPSR